MATILGISANYHDAAAALVIDGQLVAAMQEERFSRIKNDPVLPLQAAHACLKLGGIDSRALDEVVFYENPYAKLERVLTSMLRTFPRSFRQFPRALAAQLGGKLFVLDALAKHLGVPRERVTYREHHASHAASAYFASPFQKAAVLTVDAVGESTSTAIWLGDGSSLTCKERIAYPHSLGLLYSAITAYLGFEIYEGEYKVMGLAAFGQPRFRAEFARLIQLDNDSFTLGLDYFDSHTNLDVGFSAKLEALLGPRRSPLTPFHFDNPEDQRTADIAATLQEVLEEALLALARRALRLTDCKALCLAGGVALNVKATARLVRELPGIDWFVQPAAGDAGGALGAALLAANERNLPRTTFAHAAWGTSASAEEAHRLALAMGARVQRVADPVDEAAQRLARGEVIGFVQGRFEWGPRALGNRSILAPPAPLEIKERVNRAIKQREPFRPFAPMVLEESAGDYFGSAPNLLTRFMTTLAAVHEHARSQLAAVTHVDCTARVQTVQVDSTIGALLGRVAKLTGKPVLLNTSLNGPGEPLVRTETDALGFFLAHSIDALIVEDVLITKGRTP